ncbi:MAG: hypothetical protein IPP73_04170 [Chitinophagaceae bacterium]|nr:hypothetical protein [Chitinophagaceae bacterium]
MKVDLSYWRDMNDVRVLGGLWDYEFRASITSEVKKYRVEIKSSQFFLYEDIAKQNLVETYNIQEFLCNPHTCEIYFRLVPNSSGNTHVQQFLRFPNSITELVGLENTKNHVLYKKVKDYK